MEEVGKGEGIGSMMLRTNQDYVRFAFAPRVFAGLGMGAMTREEAIAALVAGAGPDTEAFKTYYGEGGYYSQAESVQRAEAETASSAGGSAPPPEMSPPQLYAAEVCGPTDGACIERNEQRQLANMALMENARRAYELQVCEYNAALNPGTSTDQPCGQFREQVPVPPATGPMQTAVCTSGECYTPISGDTAAGAAQRATQYATQYTPQGVPRSMVPNQNVPPRPQAGEVGTGGTGTGGGGTQPPAAGGEWIPGLSNKVLLLGAAGLAAVFMMSRGRG